MKRLSSWALLFGLALLLLLAVSATATSTPTRKLKHASGPITALAIDGPRVVYSTDGNGVYVWNVRSGATSQVRRPSKSDNPLVQEVAIAGGRVAWITRSVSGNSEETFEDLYTASSSRVGTKKIAHAYRVHEFGQDNLQRWKGDWIGGLVGSGKLLAVSRWTTKPNPGGPTFETITGGDLNLITSAGGLRRVASGEQAVVSRAADTGRVAVLGPAGSVGIYSAAGALLRQITPSSAQEIAMGGGRLVVLTKTKTLEVYNPRTGALEHTWPIKTRHAYLQVGHLQAYGRIAVFSVDPRYSSRDLRILDLKTGKSITLTRKPRSAWNDAGVGPLGLVYAANSYKAYGGHHPSGTLVFLSTARVLADIARGHAPSRAQVASRSGSAAAPKRNGDILYGGFRGKNGSRLLLLMRPGAPLSTRCATERCVAADRASAARGSIQTGFSDC
jgi:hypothetical protein